MSPWRIAIAVLAVALALGTVGALAGDDRDDAVRSREDDAIELQAVVDDDDDTGDGDPDIAFGGDTGDDTNGGGAAVAFGEDTDDATDGGGAVIAQQPDDTNDNTDDDTNDDTGGGDTT